MGSKFSPDKEEEIYQEYKKDDCYARGGKKFGIKWETVKNVVKRVEARNNSKATASKDIIEHGRGNPISSSENGTRSLQGSSVAPSTTASISNDRSESVLFPKYVRLREQGKTCIQCVIEIKLTPQEAEKLEKDYVHVKNLDQAFNVAMRLNDEGIDCELLNKEVEEKGSIRNYLSKLAEIQTSVQHEEDQLAETQLQKQTLQQNAQDLVGTILNLKASIKSLATKKKKLELDIEHEERILDHAITKFKVECEESRPKITQEAIRLIEEFMKNDNRKLEALFVSLIWALRENPAALFEICFNRGPLLPDEVPRLIQRFGRTLAIATHYCETVLHQAFINAAADDDTNPNVFDKAEPQPAFIYQNNPQQMAVPSRIGLSETLASLMRQPPIGYQPSPLDMYARELAARRQQQHPSALAAPDNTPAVWRPERSYSVNPAPDSGTCNSGQECMLDRTRQKSWAELD